MQLAMNPQAKHAPGVRQQIRSGLALLRQGRIEQARSLVDSLLPARPDDAELAFVASEVSCAEGDPVAALHHLSRALETFPNEPQLLLKKADYLVMLRQRLEAKAVATKVAELAGNDGNLVWAAGKVFSHCDDPVGALPHYQRARSLLGAQPALLYDLAIARFHSGDAEGAEADIDAFLLLMPLAGNAMYQRAILRKQTESRNHVVELRRCATATFPSASARAGWLFALAKELEDLGQDDAAFAALVEGATLKRQTLEYDAAAEIASIDAIRSVYTEQVMRQPCAGHDQPGAIFIVGMPRTGTTLVERMLGQHSEVESAGELLDFGQLLAQAVRKAQRLQPHATLAEVSLSIDFAALGRDYMNGARQAARNSPTFIDKMPVNYIYCGLIKKALPNAIIIHLVRNPMDSCYAVYKTLFGQAYHFSYDFAELANYYACYQRMMAHWRTVMPGMILEVRYEDLVAETEVQARRILEWCGLAWQPTVLAPEANSRPSTTASAAQVRRPIYTNSVQRWRRFEAGLAPLRERMIAAGVTID